MVKRRNPAPRVVNEALEWVGTPFMPHQSAKGSGCDCKGLLWGVARELKLEEAESVHALATDYDLHRIPSDRFKAGLAELFDRVEGEPKPGDVLLLKLFGSPAHIAICTVGGIAEGRAVHAQVAPAERVKEARLRSLTKLMPVDSVWRWRCR